MTRRTFLPLCVFFLLAGATRTQAQVIPQANVQTIIPHSAAGGGFITRLFITNLTDTANALTINRINQGGALVSSTNATLQPGGTLQIADSEPQRSQPLTVNWFAIGSQGSVTTSVLFEFDGASLVPSVNFRTAVGALASPFLTALTAPVRVATVNVTVGIALVNLSGSSNTIRLNLLNQAGASVAQDSITLGPFAQTAFSIQDRPAFSNVVLSSSEFLGSLQVTTASSTQSVAAVAVGNNFGQLFSLPVAAGIARTAPPPPVTVVISGFSFTPQTITIPVGTTVTWENQDGVSHSATSSDGSFDTGIFGQGLRRSITFSAPGNFPYFCQVHPSMRGTVIVQ